MTRSDHIGAILADLRSMGNKQDVEGMKRFGIQADRAFGIRTPQLRKYAKRLGKDHELANELWQTGIHEARHLAAMIDEPKKVTEDQMETWASDFNSWDICDGACNNLFVKTPFAWTKAVEWTTRDEEFVKRAGFVLMAVLSVHGKKDKDDQFRQFFPLIEREAQDNRNFVRKAVNWALRAIGKRNPSLNEKAISRAERIYEQGSKSARWIASDALRELRSEKVQTRLAKKH
jgi:3-methyladenine DNA glycosylase AlkD